MTESTGGTHDETVAPKPPGLPVLVVGRAQRLAATLPASAPSISADGRYVAFASDSSSLIPGDGNGAADVFVRDTVENTTVLVSRSRFGGPAAGCSLQPSISADGQVVAFTSSAPDLVPGDTNETLDVFVHDLRVGRMELVSRGSKGELGNHDSFSPSLSADGRFVAFSSLADNLDRRDHNHAPDVYLHDRVTHRTTLISAASNGQVGDAASGQPSISADGHLVAFSSVATNFDPQDTNGVADVYLHHLDTGSTELVSRGMDGLAADGSSSQPALSADGRAVAFTSDASNLVPGDHNDTDDVFVRRAEDGGIRQVSTTPDDRPAGSSHSPSISADGSRVTFLTSAPDADPDPATHSAADPPAPRNSAYLRDLNGEGTALIGFAEGRVPGDGDTSTAVISGGGTHVAFTDSSTDLSGQPETAPGEQVYVARVTTTAIPAPSPTVTAKQRQSEEPGPSGA